MDFALGKTILLAFLLVTVLAAAIIVIYLCIYNRFINLRIQNKSDNLHGMWTPRTVLFTTIGTALVLLVCFVIVTSSVILRRGTPQNEVYPLTVVTQNEARNTYLEAYSKEENPGYSRYVKTDGEITYTYFISQDGLNSLHPAFIVFVETETVPDYVGYTARYGKQTATERVGMMGADTLMIVGNAPKATTLTVELYFYDAEGAVALENGKNDEALAVGHSTLHLALAE